MFAYRILYFLRFIGTENSTIKSHLHQIKLSIRIQIYASFRIPIQLPISFTLDTNLKENKRLTITQWNFLQFVLKINLSSLYRSFFIWKMVTLSRIDSNVKKKITFWFKIPGLWLCLSLILYFLYNSTIEQEMIRFPRFSPNCGIYIDSHFSRLVWINSNRHQIVKSFYLVNFISWLLRRFDKLNLLKFFHR